MKENYDLILFDLDGTITDSGEGITKSVQYALSKFGIEEPDLEKLRKFIGPPLIDSFEKYYDFSREEAIRAREIFNERYQPIGWKENRPYDGIEEVLKALKKEGKMLLLAAAGPMGLGTIDYVLHSGNQPKVLVVADINSERLERARRLFPEAEAAELGTTLVYVNTADTEDPAKALHEISKAGYDDVFVFTPVASVCELASKVLGRDG